MIMDKQTLFSEAQAVFSAGTTVTSTNVIDLLKVAQDLGVGEQLYIAMQVTTAFVGGTSITFNLVTDDNAGMASVALVQTLGVLTIGQLAINTLWFWRYPIVTNVAKERYIAINYVSTGTSTAGAVTTGITKDIQKWTAYPSNFVSA
jgi:hypothetical protein